MFWARYIRQTEPLWQHFVQLKEYKFLTLFFSLPTVIVIQFSTVNQVREEQRLDIYLVSKNHLKKEEEHLALVFFFLLSACLLLYGDKCRNSSQVASF